MPAPYRQVANAKTIEAPTRHGIVRLEVAPRHVELEIAGKWRVTVHEGFLTWIHLGTDSRKKFWRRRKPRKRSVRLSDCRLLVARKHLTEDLGLWLEEKPGIFRRFVGIEPVVLLDAAALDAWKKLERLGRELASALAQYGGESSRATEFGSGQHRVLLVDFPEHCEVLARPVFRERQRPVFRAYRDGNVVNLKKSGQKGKCISRYSVTVGGDSIRFFQSDGERAAELYLPWVSSEDRAEIAQRFRALVDGAAGLLRAQTEADDRRSDHHPLPVGAELTPAG